MTRKAKSSDHGRCYRRCGASRCWTCCRGELPWVGKASVSCIWVVFGALKGCRTSGLVDWFLDFLCQDAVAQWATKISFRDLSVRYVLGTKAQALQLFECLSAAQSRLPEVASRHLEALQSSRSTAAEQVLETLGQRLEGPERLLQADQLVAPTETSLEEGLGGRSVLDELAVRWELQRSQARAAQGTATL